MPELPEVTTTVNGLNETVVGKTITDVWSDYFKNTKNKQKNTIKNESFFNYFKKETISQTVLSAERRGKNILIHLSGDRTILIHMKMTGHLLFGSYYPTDSGWKSDDPHLSDPFNQFIHLIFSFSDGTHLAFSDVRKFAKVTLFETTERNNIAELSLLGPEPLHNLTVDTLTDQLHKKPNGKIKTVLMDQSVLSGIGNIYSDEILWLCGIHPERRENQLTDKDISNILHAMKQVLTESISLGGDSLSDYRNIYGKRGGFQNAHKVYRRTKEKCLKRGCGGTILRKIVGGRSSHFCDTHQKM